MGNKIKNKRIMIKFLVILIALALIIKIVPIIIFLAVDKDTIMQSNSKSDELKKYIIQYNIVDLVKYLNEQEMQEDITIRNNSNLKYIIGSENVIVNVSAKNLSVNSIYTVIYGVGEELVEENIQNDKVIEITLDKEGANQCYVAVKSDGNIIEGAEWSDTIYYVKPYKEQFLDELSNKGICTHYQNGTWEIYNKSSELLKSLGVKYVRTDFSQTVIQKENGTYDFSKYDEWIEDLTDTSEIQPIILLNGVDAGDDYLINSDDEIERFSEFFKAIKQHYSEFLNIEVLNEVNYSSPKKGAYLNQEDMQWYSKLLNKISVYDRFDGIMTAGTASTPIDQKAIITSANFIKYIYNTGGFNGVNSIAYHPYSRKSNWFYSMIKEHKEYSNSIGGFNHLNVTEYGYSSSYCENDEEQGKTILKMTVSLEEDSNLIVLYDLWTTTVDPDSLEKYGLLNVDFTPKNSYYIMKNYYEKTNGGEYIGNFQIANGVMCHVYDKDGKAILMVWTNDENNTDEISWSDNVKEEIIDYDDFTAYDLYGKK